MSSMRILAHCGFLILIASMGVEAEQGSPHDLTQARDRVLCQSCHQVAAALAAEGKSASQAKVGPPHADFDGVKTCTACHGEDISHMVGVEVDFDIPKDLPLSEEGEVTCLTCHKVHGTLKSDTPWANVNFFDRLFDTEAMRKTYLLRRNNVEGQLCLICHAAGNN